MVPLAESDILVKECLIRSISLISSKACTLGLVASVVFAVALAVVVSVVVWVVVWVVLWVVVVSVVLKVISRVEDELVEWDRVLSFFGSIRT